MSIGYKIPAVAHLEQEEQKRMWKNKNYTKKQTGNENKVVSLPSQMTSPGEAWPMERPLVPPEKRPSVRSAQDLPR